MTRAESLFLRLFGWMVPRRWRRWSRWWWQAEEIEAARREGERMAQWLRGLDKET